MSLQVVEHQEPTASVPKKYEAILLSTQEMYDKYWAQCVPHLEKCVATMHGELTVEDIYTRALQGQMYVLVAKNDDTEVPEVKLVLVMELVYYPQYTTMNVVAMGGKDLRHLIKLFWPDVCGWARICGVKKIECSVAPAMERILLSTGFERKYIQLQQDLMEV